MFFVRKVKELLFTTHTFNLHCKIPITALKIMRIARSSRLSPPCSLAFNSSSVSRRINQRFPKLAKLGLAKLGLAVFIALLAQPVWSLDAQEIDWEALVPSDWNPAEPFERYSEVELEQMSYEEISLLEAESQQIYDAAPAVADMDGKQVRIPGYILPLEFSDKAIKEFLLVPYIGACIHVPPPPANQIVYAQYADGFKVDDLYTAVWVYGELSVENLSSQLGETGYDEKLEVNTGYSMQVERIELYEVPSE